jgi:hypothetical protein
MFRTAPVTESATGKASPVTEVIPLSVLQLDHPEPAGGWDAFLTVRNIEVVTDDIGRLAISRGDARRLILEKQEHEARARELAARQEREAVEADRLRRAALPKGLPWYELPPGLTAAELWAAAEKDARPRRESPLQHALSNEGGIVFHPIQGDEDAS